MPDLEARKMLAEFAGWRWPDIGDETFEDGKETLVGSPPGQPFGNVEAVPHYESDPAAACSLLPKLCVVFAGIDPQVDSERESYFADFWIPLWEALTEERDEEVCALIADAAKELEDA